MSSDIPSDSDQTFLFADLAGFTALTEAHGDQQAADLAEDFCRRIASLAEGHDAETIKTIGDAVLLRVSNAEEAIRLGLAVVHELSEVEGYPAIRVGMHSGAAVERAGDWYGGAVNLAARVSAAAGGGEVLVTGAARAAAGAMEEIEFQTLGERRFKNLTEPVPLFRARSRATVQGELDIDPVCRMAIAAGRSVGSLAFAGEVFHFCSLKCAGKFASAPEQFASSAAAADRARNDPG